jgi:hypothetical protein
VTQIAAQDAWTPQEAASHVTEAWQGAVAAVIETGRRLIEAKARTGHGGWLPTVALLPFSESTAQRLMQVARHPDLSNPAHVRDLPPSWGTLAILAQLPPGEIPARIAAGELTPELNRDAASRWAAEAAAARKQAIEAYAVAAAELARALDWARVSSPPGDLPDGSRARLGERQYPTPAGFAAQAAELAAITRTWNGGDVDADDR